jgi:hypothetical protein
MTEADLEELFARSAEQGAHPSLVDVGLERQTGRDLRSLV